MAMSDGYQRFVWVNIGDYGGLNNAGIFQWSDLGQSLEREEVEFPQPCRLPGFGIIVPYFIIGDGGFALKNYITRPFSKGINYGNGKKIFNYRLSPARRLIECAFGTLTRRWRILESDLDLKLETSEIIILALVCMHNFLITGEINKEENLKHYICNDNADDLIHNDDHDNSEADNDNDIYDDVDDNDYDDDAILRDHVDFNNSIQMRQTLANYCIF